VRWRIVVAMARKARADSSRPEGPVRVVLLAGGDSERKADSVRRWSGHVSADFADFDLESIDGHGATAERVLSAVSTVPFGEGRRVVVVRDTQQMDPEEQKRLAAGLGLVPSSGLLVLSTGTPVLEEGRTRKQSVVANELSSAVKAMGDIEEHAAPKADELRPRLVALAREAGRVLEPAALSLLVQLPADDLVHAERELEKAILHAGDSERISVADVEAVLARGPDDVIFRLCDAVGARRPGEALAHVATLFQAGGRPDSIAPRALVLLARQIRLILQFRYLGEKRMVGRSAAPLTDEVRALLPADGAVGMVSNPRTGWMVDKFTGQARRFSVEELLDRMERLLDADLRLKGVLPGGEDPKGVLQRLVLDLC